MNNQLSDISALSSISTQYRKFSKGQYIEHTQFNEFLDFFEDQDRLSRVMLQGVGIVCGLKPNLIYTNKILTSVQLSQGVAITTDGDLLTLNNTSEVSKDLYMSDLKTINIESKNYTHFKAYDNFKVGYPSFYDEKGLEQVELWELVTVEETNNDFQPISNLSNLQDKYMLLYLEDYEKDIKPCRGVDCDNHGVQQIRNLKVLVTNAKGIVRILGEDRLIIDPITGEGKRSRKDRVQPHSLFLNDIMKPVKQERVIVERLVLENADKGLSPADLNKLYKNALEKNGYGEFVFKKINAISEIIGTQTVYHQAFKDTLVNILNQKIGFQYAYDVMKDLMDTYSEIIQLLPKSFTKGFPDLDSFPKHVMLGKLVSDIQLDEFRHRFYNSPVLDDENATERVKVLMNRFSQQVQNFKYPLRVEVGPEIKSQIKITPSQKLNPLSDKAIPFYYQTSGDFLKTWNFDKTNNRSSRDNLGFNTDLVASDMYVKEPLYFNIDKNSFYNIEGHQGMNYREVFSQLKEIKDKFQLGFDVMVLSLEELVDNKDLFKGYFNEYVDKNPGLEHKRGVERGGTFIIVYESMENPIVFADFSLPYICCTPKTEVKLSLPNTVICSTSKHIPFTVTPLNGDVEAMVRAGLKGGVEFGNGQYLFNPELVSQELYGQEITFTVNGKPTNCSIKVIPQPKVEIIAHHVDYPINSLMPTTLHFTIAELNGYNLMDYDYHWDFWEDGGLIPLKPDTDGNFVYKLYNLDPKRIPTIRLYVGNTDCTQTIIIKDWYDAPKVELSFSDKESNIIICSGSPYIPFKVSPTDGVVEASKGDGVQFIGGQYVFDPKLVADNLHGSVISFSVNGQQTNCTAEVITQPNVTIDMVSVDYPSSTEAIINFRVSGPYFKNYTYYVNGDLVFLDSDGSGNISYTLKDPKNFPTINVTVSNGQCTQTIVIRDWYHPPRPSVTINSIDFPKGNCCEGTPTRKVTAYVESDEKTISLSTTEILLIEGWAVGASNFDYSWFQTYSDNNVTLPLEVSTEKTLKISRLRMGAYEFQFIAIDSDTGVFDTKKIKVFINE